MTPGRITLYEWIVTNSLGGYGLGTADLLNQRKYHGLLIASDKLFRRSHLVSSIEETVFPQKGEPFPLDSSNYPCTVFPEGRMHLEKFSPVPCPRFIFSHSGETIEKSIRMHPGMNAVSVSYRNLGRNGLKLVLRPKFSMRDHHRLNRKGRWDEEPPECSCGRGGGIISAGGLSCAVIPLNGSIDQDFLVYRNVAYPAEARRGYESTEDLAAPFKIVFEISPGGEHSLIFSDRSLEPEDILSGLSGNRINIAPGSPGPNPTRRDEYRSMLMRAFSDFFANDDLVAGYPWFSAWGRDTMISMETFGYFPGMRPMAKNILLKYGGAMRDGLIPNTIGEGGEGANYDSVDASLWFGLRAMEFIAGGDEPENSVLFGFVSEIIRNYLHNPFLPFTVDDSDGLITLHPGTNLGLTWMDARVRDFPVTPRYGKPVEINGLWYNLLQMFTARARFMKGQNACRPEEARLVSEAETMLGKAADSMMKFFNGEYFFDRITEDGKFSDEIRPNYIISLSLPHIPFQAPAVLAGYNTARKELLTPCGLRTLSPRHPAFRGLYMGNQAMRDLAYHQGTVWVWLLLPMAKVALKALPARDAVRDIEEMTRFFRTGFLNGGMSSAPEIYDGESPGPPKGCPAQCWSVSALTAIEKILQEAEQE